MAFTQYYLFSREEQPMNIPKQARLRIYFLFIVVSILLIPHHLSSTEYYNEIKLDRSSKYFKQVYDRLKLEDAEIDLDEISNITLILRTNGKRLAFGDIIIIEGDHKNLPETFFLTDKTKDKEKRARSKMFIYDNNIQKLADNFYDQNFVKIKRSKVVEDSAFSMLLDTSNSRVFSTAEVGEWASELYKDSKYLRVKFYPTDSTFFFQHVMEEFGVEGETAEWANANLLSVHYDTLYLLPDSEINRKSIPVKGPSYNPLRDKYMTTDHEELLERQVTTVLDPTTGKVKKVEVFSREGAGVEKALPKDVTIVEGDLKKKKVKAIKYFFPETSSLPDVFVKKNDLPRIKELRSGGKELRLENVRDVDKHHDVYVPPEFPNDIDLTVTESGEGEVKKYILPTISLSLLLFMAL